MTSLIVHEFQKQLFCLKGRIMAVEFFLYILIFKLQMQHVIHFFQVISTVFKQQIWPALKIIIAKNSKCRMSSFFMLNLKIKLNSVILNFEVKFWFSQDMFVFEK